MADLGSIKALFISGGHQECIQACQAVLQQNPEDTFALKYAGKSLLALGQIEQAQNCLAKAHQLDPSDPETVKDIGNCLLAAGNRQGAASAYRKSLEIRADYAPAINNLGGIAQQEGNHQAAIELFLRANKLDPSLTQASLGAAQSALAIGSWDLAINCCNRALQTNGKQSGFNLIKGIALQNKEEPGKALSAYENELKTNPGALDAYLNAAIIHLQTGNPNAAERLLLQLLALQPEHNNGKLILAQAQQRTGKWEEAAKNYQGIAFSDIANAMVPFNLGLCLLELERNNEALAAFIQATRRDPNLVAAWGNIGNLLKENGKLQEALDAYNRVLSHDPNNPMALDAVADIKWQEGNLTEAVSLLRRALEISPNDYRMLANLGFLLCEDGQYDQAVEVCRKSIAINPEYPDAYGNIAPALKEQGQLDQALAATLKAIELKPDHADAHMNLGGILKEQGQIEQSNDSYAKAFHLRRTYATACSALLRFSEIYADRHDIEHQSHQYLRNLRSIFIESNDINNDDRFMDFSLFMLTYHNNSNEKEFMENVAAIVRPKIEVKRNTDTSHSQGAAKSLPNSASLRIGFYFDNVSKQHVIFRHYYNVVRSCRSNDIDVVIIKGPSAAAQDDRELRQISTKTIQLPNNIRNSVALLESENLDILVYTEIFSSPTPYVLAYNRLAPIQVALPGNSMTTGLETIDYFISSRLTEPDDADQHYTERLIRLSGILTAITTSGSESTRKSRKQHGLPDNARLIGLTHNPIKYHPDWDQILERIASANPKAIFIVSQSKSKQANAEIRSRWTKSAPTLLKNCMFIAKTNFEDYMSLLANLDLLLDPLYKGCGTTTFDAFSVGTPIVTMPSSRSRGRLVFSLYKAMGIQGPPIAYAPDEYVSICTFLLSSPGTLANLRQIIKVRYRAFLENQADTIDEFVCFLRQSVALKKEGDL